MIALILMLGCAGGEDTDKDGSTSATDDSGVLDSETDGGTVADEFCTDAPVVTYENWGEGFMVERCQSCHASGSVERNGAPAEISFDTHDAIVAQTDRILARALDVGDMPPSGGVTEDDLYLLEVWLSCWEDPLPGTGGIAQDDSTPTPDEDDAPYLPDDTEVDLPSFNAEAVGEALGPALAQARSISAVPVVQSYFEATAGMDSDCPGWLNFDGTEYWYDYCTAGDGTVFDGYGAHVIFDGYALGDGNLWDGYQISSLGTVITPAGDIFEAAGGAYVLWTETNDGGFAYQSYLDDGFAYDGPAAQGSWMTTGISPSLSSYILSYPIGGWSGNAVVLSGQILVDDGSISAVVFEDFFLYSELLGSPCPEEPDGLISVLDSSGNWIDLLFDGGQWGEEVDAAVCDGCGAAWYQGNLLGEVCADFSSVLDWTESPWE